MKTKNVSYSDYWLNEIEEFNDEFDEFNQDSVDLEMIRLSSARRAISNFVHILTNKRIPVYFNNKEANLTDGKNVYLGADISNKDQFDPSVGLALHEGSHILLSDFTMLKNLWGKIPREIYDITDPKNISKETVISTVKTIWNIIEDRYIDSFVYKNAPGYRGYYNALYNKYFNNSNIDAMLKSDMYRVPSIDAYVSRICNFININTDLTALPDLKYIAQLIDIKNISRLVNALDRFELAFEVSKVIFSNVNNNDTQSHPTKSGLDSEPSNDKEGLKVDMDMDADAEEEEGSDSSMIQSVDALNDILGGEQMMPIDNIQISEKTDIKINKGNTTKFSENKLKAIERALEKQKKFLNGDIKKKNVTDVQKTLLQAIEKSGMTIEKVGKDLYPNTSFKGIECVVVRNLTRDLILNGEFPMTDTSHGNTPLVEMVNAVNNGIIMGNKLGTKLLLRNETNITKFMRKSNGKIDKRTIAELGFDNDRVFYNNQCDKYNQTFIHISVDASSSMTGKKWYKTMTAVVAICKACSMVENINVTVSFRTTITTKKGNHNPYVVIGYDSSKDKFSKIVNLFPFLRASGTTPEGLAFEATTNCFKESMQDKDCYFLNFSDGEPFMNLNTEEMVVSYSGEIAFAHTRKQVNKIKEKGYNILSYYINDVTKFSQIDSVSLNNFKKMYGKNASFINTENINMIAKSLNEIFLRKD